MTFESLKTGLCRFTLPEPEADFLLSHLAQLGAHYREPVSELNPPQRRYWEGTLSHEEAPTLENLEESQQVLAQERAALRSERLGLVENWQREYELAESRDPWVVEVTVAERDDLLAMINDRRLLLALELGVTGEEMEMDPAELKNEERRRVITAIDILGHFIFAMLGPQIYRP